MTAGHKDLLRQGLECFMDSADAPPHLGDRLAERALTGARRHRLVRGAAVAAFTVASVVTALVLPISLRDAGSATVESAKPATLPSDSTILDACLKKGFDFPGLSPAERRSGVGTHRSDFRVLAAGRLPNGDVAAFLGTTAGQMVCTLTPDNQVVGGWGTANSWSPAFGAMTGAISRDTAGGDLLTVSHDRREAPGYVEYVAGRADKRAVKLTFSSPKGQVGSAIVANGYYLWATTGRGRTLPPDEVVKATVKMYDRNDHLFRTLRMEVSANLFTRIDTTHMVVPGG